MGTPWLIVFLAAAAAATTTTLCPDGTTCDEDHLCCELSGNQGYGCCSKEEVVSRSLPMISTVKSCSDLTSCPTEYSCVETPQGNSACCPLPQGSSCQDGNHCCPSGTVCSEDGHHCIPASNLTAVICPDGKSECPNDSTCCILPNQSWGCCPIPQASCCSDHLHCCPQSTVCDLQHGRCVSGDGTESPWMNKLPARVRLVAMGDSFKRTQCSDGSSCPNGATCCQQKDGTYGCCPFTDGVCCRDYVHCCPSGTLCDLSHQKCTSKSMEMPLFTRTPALKAEDTDVKCDDATSCPGDSTCCRLQSGEWGCCPISGAVCCDDHVHCCPGGFTCSGSQCIGDGVSIPLLRKGPALQHKDIYVQCNDTAYCPDKETCCLLETGQWGCCPLEHAVCCDDHEHCCPSGYTCTGGQCSQGMVSTPGLKKTPALSKPSAAGAGNVRCDDETSCPDESTCCRTESGEWGCCPIEKGVCCSDHLHCCPEGYTCDVSAGSCVKPQLDTEPEQAAPMTPIQPLNYVWCDAQYACNDFQTCCRGLSTLWICCPLYQAVCCPDRMHCCPYGHICLNSGAACSRSGPLRWDGKTEPHTLL